VLPVKTKGLGERVDDDDDDEVVDRVIDELLPEIGEKRTYLGVAASGRSWCAWVYHAGTTWNFGSYVDRSTPRAPATRV